MPCLCWLEAKGRGSCLCSRQGADACQCTAGWGTHTAKTHVHTSTCTLSQPGSCCENQPSFSATPLPTGQPLLGTGLLPAHPLLASHLLAACAEVHLILSASLGDNGWVSQALGKCGNGRVKLRLLSVNPWKSNCQAVGQGEMVPVNAVGSQEVSCRHGAVLGNAHFWCLWVCTPPHCRARRQHPRVHMCTHMCTIPPPQTMGELGGCAGNALLTPSSHSSRVGLCGL